MKKIFLVLVIAAAIVIVLSNEYFIDSKPDKLSKLTEKYSKKRVPSIDHSKLKELQKEFKSAQEVTETCLSCHTERHKEVMKSSHWNWEREEYIKGRGVTYVGKKNLINNFCIGIGSNEKSCTRCHAGYGWEDNSFDFSNEKNVDCMVCHADGDIYVKGKEMAGYPDTSVNLAKAAQSVGSPKRNNCGYCHFYSGGGNNVKHGDLEDALYECTRDLDVHMNLEGANLECVDCHTAENHVMKGKLYAVSSMNKNRMECEHCHTSTPHEDGLINEHTVKVSCQACHIPIYAKENATKMSWDWSTAGKLQNGEPYSVEDKDGNHTYLTIKGSFTWGKKLKPDYMWFNGTANHYLLCDKVGIDSIVEINTLYGDYNDKNSKIIPVKIHNAKQIYDAVNKCIIQPKLYADNKGEGAFWKDFDWKKAAELGMEAKKLPYSGKYAFIYTKMYWPINHMVSPKEETVKCAECHTRNDSRLAALTDFYLPGRDYSSVIDKTGLIFIILSLSGVLVHGMIRIILRNKNV